MRKKLWSSQQRLELTPTRVTCILNYMFGIDLSSNKLVGEIPPELGRISNIHALNFSHNNLFGPIPITLSKIKLIESLDISYNNLSGKIPRVDWNDFFRNLQCGTQQFFWYNTREKINLELLRKVVMRGPHSCVVLHCF